MSYGRVVPRDLFNEANLLKCLGKIEIYSDSLLRGLITTEFDNRPFEIEMNPDDGSIYCENFKVFNRYGDEITLYVPLYSREQWPLYFRGEEDEKALDGFGKPTKEFLEYLKS
jgi:hypothetical protein